MNITSIHILDKSDDNPRSLVEGNVDIKGKLRPFEVEVPSIKADEIYDLVKALVDKMIAKKPAVKPDYSADEKILLAAVNVVAAAKG